MAKKTGTYNQLPAEERNEPEVEIGNEVTDSGTREGDPLEKNDDVVESKKLVAKDKDALTTPSSEHHVNHHNITVDDAIERLGMGKFQLMVLVAVGLCFAADAMQVLMLSFLCEVSLRTGSLPYRTWYSVLAREMPLLKRRHVFQCTSTVRVLITLSKTENVYYRF
jgi:hypothetical protein